MKRSFEQLEAWLKKFYAWREDAPESCKDVCPMTPYWGLDNCSEEALAKMKDKYGGSLYDTAGGSEWILDVSLDQYAFRFTTGG